MIHISFLLMGFVASQFGLGNLPKEIQAAASAIPEKFYGLLRTAVSKAFKSLPCSGASESNSEIYTTSG